MLSTLGATKALEAAEKADEQAKEAAEKADEQAKEAAEKVDEQAEENDEKRGKPRLELNFSLGESDVHACFAMLQGAGRPTGALR